MMSGKKVDDQHTLNQHMITGHMITGDKPRELDKCLMSPLLSDQEDAQSDQEDAQSGGKAAAPDVDPFGWMDGVKWVTWVARGWIWHGCFLCFAQTRLYLAVMHGQLSTSTDADTVSRMMLWSVAVAFCDMFCMISGVAVLILNLRLLCNACVGAACMALAMVVAYSTAMVPVIGAQARPACWRWKVGYF